MNTADDVIELEAPETDSQTSPARGPQNGIEIDDLKEISRLTYFLDFVISASIFYASFVYGGMQSNWLIKIPLYVVSVLSVYRMSVFSHEIVHMGNRFPTFVVLWNLICAPVILYTSAFFRSHIDHHRSDSYGSDKDPEYVKFWENGYVSKLYLGLSPLVPFMEFFKRAVLIPASWLIPAYRKKRAEKESLASIHGNYIATPHIRPASGFEKFMEVLITIECLAILGFAIYDSTCVPWIVKWLSILGCGILINSARTLYAHRYTIAKSPVPLAEQFDDSITLDLHPVLAFLVAPVGLKYHAIHHLFPYLPYHSLGKAHRRLLAASDSVRDQYTKTFLATTVSPTSPT